MRGVGDEGDGYICCCVENGGETKNKTKITDNPHEDNDNNGWSSRWILNKTRKSNQIKIIVSLYNTIKEMRRRRTLYGRDLEGGHNVLYMCVVK